MNWKIGLMQFFSAAFFFCNTGTLHASEKDIVCREGDAEKTSQPVRTCNVLPMTGQNQLLRRRINPSKANEDLSRLEAAIRYLRANDTRDKFNGSPWNMHERVLAGYDAISAVHGFNIFEPSDKEKDVFNRLRIHISKECEEKRSNWLKCGFWNRCVHRVDGGVQLQDKLQHESETSPLFLLWHRAYIRAFEYSVNSVLRTASREKYGVFHNILGRQKAFGLPYWGWLFESSESIPQEFRSEARGECSSNEPTGDLKVRRNSLLNCSRLESAGAGAKIFDAGNFGNPEEILDLGDFATFSYALESRWHDAVHDAVGGDLSNPETAVQDPLFWAHHSFVDFLLEEWLKKYGRGFCGRKGDRTVIASLERAWKEKDFSFIVIDRVGRPLWYRPEFSELGFCDKAAAPKYELTRKDVLDLAVSRKRIKVRYEKRQGEQIMFARTLLEAGGQSRNRNRVKLLAKSSDAQEGTSVTFLEEKKGTEDQRDRIAVHRDGLLLELPISPTLKSLLRQASRGQHDFKVVLGKASTNSIPANRKIFSLHFAIGYKSEGGVSHACADNISPMLGLLSGFGMPTVDSKGDVIGFDKSFKIDHKKIFYLLSEGSNNEVAARCPKFKSAFEDGRGSLFVILVPFEEAAARRVDSDSSVFQFESVKILARKPS